MTTPTPSLSEDPATNLTKNVESILTKVASTRSTQTPPIVSGKADPTYFNTDDLKSIKAIVERVEASPGDTDTKALDLQAALQEKAGTESEGATKDEKSPTLGELALEASTPNVLGSSSRRSVAMAAIAIAAISVFLAFGVLFFAKDTERISLLLVGLAAICVVVAYLTTMGFGAVQVKYGPKEQSGTTDPATP